MRMLGRSSVQVTGSPDSLAAVRAITPATRTSRGERRVINLSTSPASKTSGPCTTMTGGFMV